jgi:sorbitol-specific phosphotransferase system component IIA
MAMFGGRMGLEHGVAVGTADSAVGQNMEAELVDMGFVGMGFDGIVDMDFVGMDFDGIVEGIEDTDFVGMVAA